MGFKKNGLNQCHRCIYNAGVRNGEVQCLSLLNVVFRDNEEACPDQEAGKPGKVLHLEEFKEEVEFIKSNKK